MKTIGLIGGMSWESTAVYYRCVNTLFREKMGALHSAEIILHSLDFERVVALQKSGDWHEAGSLLGRAAAGLERAGADCVLICTNTMHLVANEVAASCTIPLLNIIDETGRAILATRCRRPLLLATRYTMEHSFYQQRLKAATGMDCIVPEEADRALVHSIIFDELCQGIVREESRDLLTRQVIARGLAAGADCVILGCTEICLLLDPHDLPCPGFDSTAIHARAAVEFALAAPEQLPVAA